MSYNYARFADLKSKLVAALLVGREERPIEICKDRIYLDVRGVWFSRHLGNYNPINVRDDEFGTLIDHHLEDYFCGTHDTFEGHADTILANMETALLRLLRA